MKPIAISSKRESLEQMNEFRSQRFSGWMNSIVACFVLGSFLASGCATTGSKGLGGAGLLQVGSEAPELSVANWVQGSPVSEFEEGKVYIVEFWATWCGPCIAGMPHLAEIQKTYGDKVQVIGISSETQQTVLSGLQGIHPHVPTKTVAQVADYTLAVDNNGRTNAAYMKAAQIGTIPNAFLVGKDGRIKYIGHPGKIDNALEAALNE